MLLWLANQLSEYYRAFAVINYITLRAVLGCLSALIISISFGPLVIRKLRELRIGQSIREDGPRSHLKKSGTPTMGGTLILISISISVLLWADLSNRYIWILMAVMLSIGALGFYDDYLKVVKRNSRGISARFKMLVQSVVAVAVGLALLYIGAKSTTELLLPFFKNVVYPFGVFGFLILTYFVIVGTSNAVNLTDGLDGLVAMPIVMVAAGLSVFAYVVSNAVFARYLGFPFIPGTHEIVVFCAAICGSVLGFLWFNIHPAQVFMGDVGALSLGAILGTIAVIIRQEIVLFIMGGVFVAEAISVMLQVFSFKVMKRRVFLMAPLHHHFELTGIKETQVVVRFWILTMILVLIGLATLKLR